LKRARLDGWFSLLVLLLVIGLAFVAQGLREDPEAHAHSVTSTGEAGRRGFFLLARELGFAPVEWRRAPGELPPGEHVLWLPERPSSWKPKAQPEDASPEPLSVLPNHRLENYRRFVEEGGTLVAPLGEKEQREKMLEFVTHDLGLAAAGDVQVLKVGESKPRRVRLDTGEQLALELDVAAVLKPLQAGSAGRELWMLEKEEGEDGPENLVAVEFDCGAGRVVLLSEDDFLDNDSIGKHQHALAGVRLLEQLSRGGQLFFDEYCLGNWEPESTLSLAASPRVFLLGAHLLALLVLFVWAHSFARAFPRDPPPLAAASPLERAETLARLWRGSGRPELAARALRRAAAGKGVRKPAAAELEELARELEPRSRERG
jgi:hypothetical protein